MSKLTLVIGASENPERYSYKAIHRLRQHAHPVVAIGPKAGKVADIHYANQKEMWEDVDTVTLYINPKHQADYQEYILSLKPKRILFNPGTENEDFKEKAQQAGIQVMEACTLVLLGTGQY